MEHTMEHTGRFRTVLFNESNLVKLKGKWYVVVTVPAPLQAELGKQRKRSTGTSDRGEALRRKHDITEELYDLFRERLRVSKFGMTEKYFEQEGMKVHVNDETIHEVLDYIRAQRTLNTSVAFDQDDKAIAELESALETPDNTYEPDTHISAVASQYFEQRVFEREKTKTSAASHVQQFIEVVGDIDIKEVQKVHAYRFCDSLDKDGQASKTINSKMSSIRAMMTWCEQQAIISDSPFHNLSLKTYGKRSVSYRPIPDSVTTQIALDPTLGRSERLLLACLYFTGCRIDEWATATYDMIKMKDGIPYLDLLDSKVKNEGSRRLVPLHPTLHSMIKDAKGSLKDGTGRIFDYATDVDGKATNAASKALMSAIRKHTSDQKHSAHSYRHGFKDMLRNLGVSKEVNDFITGHSSGDVAGKYGSGVSLQVRYEAVSKISSDAFAP